MLIDHTSKSLINIEISGYEFNRLYKDKTKFYRFLNDNLTHYGFKYVLGLNIDTNEFNPNGDCEKGGLYFCDDYTCYLFCTYYGKKIALIEIPDDSRVWIEHSKCKADRLIITEIIDFVNMPDTFWINIISPKSDNFEKSNCGCGCGYVLQYVKDSKLLTENICSLAVKQYPLALEYVPNIFKTEEICTLAVKENGLALRFVNDQYLTEAICILALQQNIGAFKYVSSQLIPNLLTEKLLKYAVSQEGNNLKYVKDQTEEICKLAVKQNGLALRYVNQDSSSHLTSKLLSKSLIEEIYILAVQQNGKLLYYVKEQTEKICAEAVQQNGDAIHYIINQTEEICLLAVRQDGLSLYYIKEQTDNICITSVKQNGNALRFVQNQTDEICILAVEQNGNALQYVKNQTANICILAVRQNAYALEFVEERFKSLFV